MLQREGKKKRHKKWHKKGRRNCTFESTKKRHKEKANVIMGHGQQDY